MQDLVTLLDLLEELDKGVRSSVSIDEIDQAKSRDKQLGVPTIRLPRDKEIYELSKDCVFQYCAEFRMYEWSGEAALLKGDRVLATDLVRGGQITYMIFTPIELEGVINRVLSEDALSKPNLNFWFETSALTFLSNFKFVGAREAP